MLWSRRQFVVLGAALAGCGFEPVNAPGSDWMVLRSRIKVSEPDSREAFLLTQRLEERLGQSAVAADLVLDVALDLDEVGLGIDADGVTSRFNVGGRADYTLREVGADTTLREASVASFTGYTASGTTVATLAARRDAYERLMTILADQIIQDLQVAQIP